MPADFAQPDPTLAITVDELEVSVETHEALTAAGIATVGELVAKSPADIQQLKLTQSSFVELQEVLDEMGLQLPS